MSALTLVPAVLVAVAFAAATGMHGFSTACYGWSGIGYLLLAFVSGDLDRFADEPAGLYATRLAAVCLGCVLLWPVRLLVRLREFVRRWEGW